MKAEKNIYFPGLNGLRFLAALAVIITHIELLKEIFGFKSYWKNLLIFNLGGLGVCFFFVLSGFLITYLLLVEKKETNTINIKQFYLRRILRIWPLYYFIMILGFFVLPHIKAINIHYLEADFLNYYNTNLVLYLLILPNLAFSIFSAVPHIGQAWSIGVEEQFYIIWPWVINKTKNIIRSLLFIIVGLIAIKVIVLVMGRYFFETNWYLPLKKFIAMSKFECMAIGGIGAYLLFENSTLLKILYNKYTLNLSMIMIPVLIYVTPDKIQDGIHIVYSVFFLIIILNMCNNSVKIKFNHSLFNYLGKISYGIYMYHFMIIPVILFYCNKLLMGTNEILLNIIIYGLVIITTVIVSGISYNLLERPFIKLKSRYAIIKSGEQN